MKNIIPLSLLAFVHLFLLFSCEKDNNKGNRPKNVHALNITAGDYLAIKTNPTESTEITDWSNLSKMTVDQENLQAEAVGFLDGSGNPIASVFTYISIKSMCKVSPDYICLKGEFEILVNSEIEKLTYSSLLVNLKDGSIIDFNGHYPDPSSYHLGAEFLQSDVEGSVFYHFEAPLYKLGFLDNSSIYQETYVSASQGVGDDYYISPNGDCYYYGYPTSNIKLSEGGIIHAEKYLTNLFTGADNNSYGLYFNEISRVDITNGESAITKLGETAIQYDNETYSYHYNTERVSMMMGERISRVGDKNIIGDIFVFSPFKTFALTLPTEISEYYDVIGVSSQYVTVASRNDLGKEIYVFDLNSVRQVDELSYEPAEYVALNFPTNYEVYSYTLLKNGTISFIGYDLSNELDVSGILTLENELLITDAQDDYVYRILQKLN